MLLHREVRLTNLEGEMAVSIVELSDFLQQLRSQSLKFSIFFFKFLFLHVTDAIGGLDAEDLLHPIRNGFNSARMSLLVLSPGLNHFFYCSGFILDGVKHFSVLQTL